MNYATAESTDRARTGRAALISVALLLPLVGVVLLAGVRGALTIAGEADRESAETTDVSEFALRDIPLDYLRLYERAGERYGVDWAILAAIGKIECDDGRDPDPSCSRPGSENAAGAGGPMQFLASTWARYGVDGDGDGIRDRWDPADAIFAAANYLRASGAPRDYAEAIYAYNHAAWYVQDIERLAARYRRTAAAGETGSPTNDATFVGATIIPVEGERARLDPANGHIAMIPTDVPPQVQAMLIAGNQLQELPYGPDGHPDPLEAPDEDCSSTINYVLYRAGIRPLSEILARNPLAQDYVRWGAPGPGRWVTIYAADEPTPHVFAVIAGLRIDTSHDGTDVGPNRDENGPRWRILDRIPTWAHWSVRHPPGL